jgi:uncharacterized protein DUF6011
MSFSTLIAAKEFAFAGRALLTLESKKTGAHHTYKINECQDAKGLFFVFHLIAGSADEGNFAYLGVVKEGRFFLTKKSTASPEAPCVQAFIFFMKSKELHPLLVIYHSNRCGRCGRTLTVPESIERGIGPECFSKMA